MSSALFTYPLMSEYTASSIGCCKNITHAAIAAFRNSSIHGRYTQKALTYFDRSGELLSGIILLQIYCEWIPAADITDSQVDKFLDYIAWTRFHLTIYPSKIFTDDADAQYLDTAKQIDRQHG